MPCHAPRSTLHAGAESIQTQSEGAGFSMPAARPGRLRRGNPQLTVTTCSRDGTDRRQSDRGGMGTPPVMPAGRSACSRARVSRVHFECLSSNPFGYVLCAHPTSLDYEPHLMQTPRGIGTVSRRDIRAVPLPSVPTRLNAPQPCRDGRRARHGLLRQPRTAPARRVTAGQEILHSGRTQTSPAQRRRCAIARSWWPLAAGTRRGAAVSGRSRDTERTPSPLNLCCRQ